ncbi:MAG: hypothetical protein EBT98_11905, partial [Opitutaceae bacterium]|nr:hypothetical protein [Opitutaceae bacterium]
MSSNKSVTATFGTQSRLSVNKIGMGTIVSTPAGINCGATCSAVYSDGTTVSLVATPSNDYTFAGWSGASCFGTGPCFVTMFGAQSVTATFN